MAITQEQARAMAYRLVDDIETKALALMAKDSSLDKQEAMIAAIFILAEKESGNA